MGSKLNNALAFFSLFCLPFMLQAQQKDSPAMMTEPTLTSIYHQQMGTQWQVVLNIPERDSLELRALKQEVIQLIDSLNMIFSDYDPRSELNRAVAAAHKKNVSISRVLAEVIAQAQHYAHRSGGAFDISIGPLSRLWRRAFRRQVFPEREAVKKAKSRVNYRWIRLRERQLRLRRREMRLDLGGIAKGATVDHLAALLQRSGVKNFLIDGGGDVRVSGHPSNRKAWEIELPNGQIIELNNGAIASSGDQYRYLEHRGERYSHLIDPRTGYGVTDQETVTVLAPTASEADAWASVFSIMKGKKARQLQEEIKGRVLVYYFKN